jgi:hypothetical protein
LGLSKQAIGQSIPDNKQSDHPYSIMERAATVADSISQKGIADDSSTFRVHCTLVDQKGEPLINANVTLSKEGIVIARDLTDFDGVGNMTIPYSEGSVYEIQFRYLGRELTISNIQSAKGLVDVQGRLALEPRPKYIVTGYIVRDQIIGAPGKRTIRGDMLSHSPR